MKNVKLILLAVTAMLFLGMGNVSAQENKVQSVIISVFAQGVSHNKYTVEVVKPDYSVELKEYTTKDNIHVALKKELDKWLEQGYQIMESSSNTIAGGYPISRYILVRKL